MRRPWLNRLCLGKISGANFLSAIQLSAKSELCLSVVLEKRSALEHPVAVAWSRPHKAVAFRRPIAKCRERQALSTCFCIDSINTSSLDQHVSVAINEIKKVIFLDFRCWVGLHHEGRNSNHTSDQ